MDLGRALLVLLVGCSSGKKPAPTHVEDADRPAPPADAASTDAAIVVDAPPVTSSGDVQIRVEWTAPLAARSSPGASACGTPLAAQVAPTTTWGIPDVAVIVDGAPAAAASARVSVMACAITPRIATGSELTIASAAAKPLRVNLAQDGHKPTTLALPISGHAVTTPLAGRSRLAVADKRTDDAWLVSDATAITDASGVALIKDVAPGTHAVRVWLPPRGGQPAREARGEVSVVAGELAELTLTLK